MREFNFWRRFRRGSLLVAIATAAALSACQLPGDEATSERQSIIAKVNAALNSGDCSTAIIEVEKLYRSAASNDEIRRLRASAHGCRTGLGFFEKLEELVNADLSTNGPWRAITLMFPSTAGDQKMESAFFATDALQAWIRPEVVVFDPYRLTFDPFNPGSLRAADLELDANIYLLLTSMATIGTLHHRHGDPDANGAPQDSLPWDSLSAVDTEGCGYVSALLNMSDSLGEIASSISQLSGVSSAVSSATAGFDAACQAGCAACGLSCSGCPDVLRHRSACDRATPATAQIEACAAAGLVGNVMNNALVGWR